MEERIKQLEETVETLKTNLELVLGIVSRLKMNGKSLYAMQLEQMIKDRN